MQNTRLAAFTSLYKEHAEDMVILAYLLLQDSQKANTVVEEILHEIWEGNNFDSLDASELYNRVREVCNS